MIKQGQVLSKDNLNAAFISKTATGTQVMLGSLNIAGSLTAASMSVPTITGNVTMSGNLYFANGTTYYVDNAGSAKFNNIEAAGTITVSKSTNAVALVLQGATAGWASGIQFNNTTATTGRKFGIYSSSSGTLQITDETSGGARISINNAGTVTISQILSVLGTSTFTGAVTTSDNLTVSKILEVQGEIAHGFENEFPDPLMASGSLLAWYGNGGTLAVEESQTPVHIAAYASVKITSSSANASALFDRFFDINVSQWVTYSLHAYATTTSKTASIVIHWYNSSKTWLSQSTVNISAVGTGWTRYSISAQSPANARYFKVDFQNTGGSGTVMYITGFQVERGRAMTGFKSYTGANQSSSNIGGITIGGSTFGSSGGLGILNLSNEDGNYGVISSKGGATIKLGYANPTLEVGNLSTGVTLNGYSVQLAAVNGYAMGAGGGGSIVVTDKIESVIHTTTGVFTLRPYASGAYGQYIIFAKAGGVGINTATLGTDALTVNGTTNLKGNVTTTGSLILGGTANGIQKANYIYFDYNGTYGTTDGHGITSKATDSLWINSMQNVTINLDTNDNNATSTFSIRRHATDDGGAILFSVTDILTKSANPISVASGSGVHSIEVDDNTNIQLKGHLNSTYFRNEAGLWLFQSGTGTEDYSKSFAISAAAISTTNQNNTFIELGERNVSTGTNGSYKGLRVIKYAGSAIVDGDFQAGSTSLTGATTVGGTLTASGALNVTGNTTMTGSLTVNNQIIFNDVSRYWLSTAGTWGIYWETTNNLLQFHGAGTTRFQVDLDDGNTLIGGQLAFGGADASVAIELNNRTISNAHKITFNDPGNDEGLEWSGGSGWKIYESPNNLTNAGGNMQFVTGSTRRMTIDTSGNLDVAGNSIKVASKYSIQYNSTEDSLDFVYG